MSRDLLFNRGACRQHPSPLNPVCRFRRFHKVFARADDLVIARLVSTQRVFQSVSYLHRLDDIAANFIGAQVSNYGDTIVRIATNNSCAIASDLAMLIVPMRLPCAARRKTSYAE